MIRKRPFLILFFIALLTQGAQAATMWQGAALGWSLFGSREIPSKNMKAFGKWTEMWRRHNLPRATDDPVAPETLEEKYRCIGRFRAKCSREAWENFIENTNTDDPFETLKAVNHYMNKSPYIVDPVNWGLPDYWATPDEFLWKDGDCEDYAISKYITLKRLGFDISTMRLVILQDENLRTAHAVLAVEMHGTIYILDNQINTVMPHDRILHYRPVYSLSEERWWLHRVNRFSK